MKYTTLIYFRYIPLTAKIWNDFYMEAIVDEGIHVEYWDLSRLFFKDSYNQEDASSLLNVCVKHFETYEKLETSIKQQNIGSTLFVSLVSYDYTVTRLFRLFTQYKCQLAVFGRDMVPRSSFSQYSFLKKLTRLRPSSLIRFYRNRKAVHWKTTGKIKGYDIIFQGGELGYKGIGCTSRSEVKQAKITKINSIDYDIYLQLQKKPLYTEQKYIVFLDEYLPLHPDAKLFKIQTIPPDKYYSELNTYFTRVETQYGIPVVIAAHPKALLYKESDYFCGRRIEFGRSAELVRNAEFVLAHDSTSIAYAVAFRKRLHLLTSHALEHEMTFIHHNVLNEAAYLGCNWQYIDDDITTSVSEVCSDKYNQYKYSYLCWPETEQLMSKDIVLEFLR